MLEGDPAHELIAAVIANQAENALRQETGNAEIGPLNEFMALVNFGAMHRAIGDMYENSIGILGPNFVRVLCHPDAPTHKFIINYEDGSASVASLNHITQEEMLRLHRKVMERSGLKEGDPCPCGNCDG